MTVQELKDQFVGYFGDEGAPSVFFSPGRVCLIGEHIDYNGGKVLPAALSLGIHAAVRTNNSGKIRFRSDIDPNEFVVDLHEPISFREDWAWANYPIGVVKYMLAHNVNIPGADVLFTSNLPAGAGLSSSAAIEVLTAYIFSQLDGKDIKKEDLALICKTVENEFMGVQCGIMDQFAVAMGKKGHAVLLDCTTLEHEYVPVELGDYELVIFNTNKKRELTESKFNERTEECRQALEAIQKHKDIAFLAAAKPGDEVLIDDPVLRKRARHVANENHRVTDAANALKKGDLKTFGDLLFQTHLSLKIEYEVSGDELDALENAARNHPACIGAKMSGAGFGGCAFALIEKDRASEVAEIIKQQYFEETGLKADHYEVEIVDGVRQIC